MGYYVKTTGADFTVKQDQLLNVVRACREMADRAKELGRGGNSDGDRWYSWVNTEELREVSTLQEAFEIWGFTVDFSTEGDVIHIEYDNKTGQEDLFLAAIAPYIDSHSSIDWIGEDGEQYRHLFINGVMFHQKAQLIYSEPTAVRFE